MSTLPGPGSVALPQLLEIPCEDESIRSSHQIEVIGDKVVVRDVELFAQTDTGPLGKVDADRLSAMVEATNGIIARGRSTMVVLRHQDDDGGTKQDTIGRIKGNLRVGESAFSGRPTVFGDMEFGRAEFDSWVRPNGFPRRSAEIVEIEADDGPDDLVGKDWIFQIALLGRELPKADLRDLLVFDRSGRVKTPHVGGDTLAPIEVFRIPEPRTGEDEGAYLARADSISRDDGVDIERARVFARRVWTAKKGDTMPDSKPFDEIVKAVRAMDDDERKKLFKAFAAHDDDKKESADNERDDDDDDDDKDKDDKKGKADNAKPAEVASYARLESIVVEQGKQLVKVTAELGKTRKDAADDKTRSTLVYMKNVEGFELDIDAEFESITALPDEYQTAQIEKIRKNYKRRTTAAGLVAGSNGVMGMAQDQRPSGGDPKEFDADKVTKCAEKMLRDDPKLNRTEVYERAMEECGFKEYLGRGIATVEVR